MDYNTLSTSVPRPEDLSVQLLDKLFGIGWENLQGSHAGSVLLEMLAIFNELAFLILAVIFTYMLARGVAGTAQTGRPLGRAYNSLWVPVRFSLVLALLAPVAGGFSTYQLVLLGGVSQSVRLANLAWEKTLDVLVDRGGVITADPPQSISDNTHQIAAGLLRSASLQWGLVNEEGYSVPQVVSSWTWTPDASGPGGTATIYVMPPQHPKYDQQWKIGDWGALSVPCPQGRDNLCAAREAAAGRLINDVWDIAEKMYSHDPVVAGPGEGELEVAIQRHDQSLLPALGAWMQAQGAQMSGDLKSFAAQAKRDGWASAGQYYWTISQLNERARDIAWAQDSYIESRATDILEPLATVANSGGQQAAMYQQATEYADRSAKARTTAAQAGAADGIMSKVSRFFSDAISWQIPAVTKKMTAGDPIVTLSDLGHTILVTAGAAWGTYLGAVAVAGGAQGYDDSLIGKATGVLTGSSQSVAIGAAGAVIREVSPTVRAGLWLLTGLGFFLAYYLPAVPYILWLAAMASWVLLVAEAILAAPLFLVANAMPDNSEGLSSAYGKQGYTLLLGILIRPPLMVAGLVCALAFSRALGFFIGLTFPAFAAGETAGHFTSIVTTLAQTILLSAIIIVTSHKTCSAITVIPERVSRWVCAGLGELGETHDAGRVTGGVIMTTQRIEGAASAGFHGQGLEVAKAAQEKLMPAATVADLAHGQVGSQTPEMDMQNTNREDRNG